jgi:hypothetical protein
LSDVGTSTEQAKTTDADDRSNKSNKLGWVKLQHSESP